MTTSLESSDVVIPQEVAAVNPVVAEEKLVPQSRVNEFIQKGYQKGYQKALEEAQASMSIPTPAPAAMPQDLAAFEEKITANAVERLKQQSQELLYQQQTQKVVEELGVKINEVAQKYPDFHEVTGSHDFSKMPELVQYANEVSGGVEGIYHIFKNQDFGKLGIILKLPPDLAKIEFKKYINSAQQNENAASTVNSSPAPLSHTKPSYSGLAAGREGKSATGQPAHTINDLEALKRLYRV